MSDSTYRRRRGQRPSLLLLATIALAAAGALPASRAWAEGELPSAPADLHLLGEGSGDGFPYGAAWTPEGRTLGLGLQLGFPTALTLEYVTGGSNSLIAGLGLFGLQFFTPGVSLYLDYLWHPGTLGRSNSLALSWYVGLGGWLTVYRDVYDYGHEVYGGDSTLAVALRVPVGLDLSLGPIPLMFYAELVPALLVFPTLDVDLGASIGARIFF